MNKEEDVHNKIMLLHSRVPPRTPQKHSLCFFLTVLLTYRCCDVKIRNELFIENKALYAFISLTR